MRQLMLGAMQKAQVIDYKMPKDEVELAFLKLQGYLPSIAEGVWVLYKNNSGSLA